ncbi:MAG TPA: TIGR04282 family arsenosugar biosynthesis glycosyltransferase [Acidobacteriaceae bacterium]|nr:TIGR04282 family arsenosugar biosynthesis glycosyltransferase [Acidobacteriaceae bacterium]
MQQDTCVCVFFKSPIVGTVKTRLIPLVGAESAAALAEAFFRDTWNRVRSLSWAVPIVASTGPLNPALLPHPEPGVWLQGGGDLGARMERILRRALAQAPFTIALGADSPGMPARLLHQAHEALQSADAVLGPSDDGGFYLLALRECPPGLLAGIPWSQPTTFARTLERFNERGLKSIVLDHWYDIDRPEDLERLCGDVASEAIDAPHTASVLAGLQAVGKLSATFPFGAAPLGSNSDGAHVR